MSTEPNTKPTRRRTAIVGTTAILAVVLLLVISGCGAREDDRPVREAVKRAVTKKPTATPVAAEDTTATQAGQTQAQAQEMLRQILVEQKQALAEAEAQRQAALALHKEDERQRRDDEEAHLARVEQAAEQRRAAAARQRREAERLRQEELLALREARETARREAGLQTQRESEERARLEDEALLFSLEAEPDETTWDDIQDDTPDIQTESTVSMGLQKKGWKISGDLRPILDGLHEESRDGSTSSDMAPGIRARIGVDFGINRWLSVGTRVAGTGFLGNFNPNFILPGNNPEGSDLESGTFGFDQLYLRWQRKDRFSLAVGRLQTRFQLRGGVYAKSLDRNNSHNWRVNWTDGLQATLKTGGWRSSFVLQVNPESGPTGVRRDPLDFHNDDARLTYFLALENFENKGALVQRAFDISYLPASLLKDGDPEGRRVDYWGFVGRLMFVWPPGKEGLRFRGGPEIGYAPETPTYAAMDLTGTGDVNGFAWNIVASAMDFFPGHSIGLNYARTGAGWLLAPQYRPNHELIELRHLWRSKKFPLLETRIRRRTELQQQIGTARPRTQWDFFIRATIRFTLLEQ